MPIPEYPNLGLVLLENNSCNIRLFHLARYYRGKMQKTYVPNQTVQRMYIILVQTYNTLV